MRSCVDLVCVCVYARYLSYEDGRFALLASAFLVSVSTLTPIKKRLGETHMVGTLLKTVQDTSDADVALNLLHSILNVSTLPSAQVRTQLWCGGHVAVWSLVQRVASAPFLLPLEQLTSLQMQLTLDPDL